MEAAEALALVGAPRAGQGGGQVGFLRQHVRRPVPQPPGLDQDDLGGVRQAIGQQPVAVDQPGEPALHAVEREAVRQALPLVPAPRLLPDQLLGAAADVIGDPQLPRREDDGFLEVVGRALVVHRELAETVDLVAPQVDAHGRVRRGREHVDDRPAAGHLAAMLHQLLTPVPGRDEAGQEVFRVQDVAGADDDRIDVVVPGAQPLEERPDGADDDPGRPATSLALALPGEAPQHPQPAPHRLDARADALEGQGLPGREQLDVVGREVPLEVVDQPLGRRPRGHRDQERRAGWTAGKDRPASAGGRPP